MDIVMAELDQAELMGQAAEMYEIFRDWNGNMSKGDIAPTLFESFYLQLMEAMFLDELGEDLLAEFLAQILLSSYVVDRCIEGQTVSWCDDISTSSVETFTDLIVPSWNASVEWLSYTYGKEPSSWEWGNLHQISFDHALGSVSLLKKVFNLERGPFSTGGSFHTVSPYAYNLSQPFSVNHGSAIRVIFSAADWDDSRVIIPTGVSGIPASDFYCNQTGMYIGDEYVTDLFSRDKVVANAPYRYTFKSD